MVKSKSGRSKVRRLVKKSLQTGKIFVFWIYDERKKYQENLWKTILDRHENCNWEEEEVIQIEEVPTYRIIRFLCYNCKEQKCFWRRFREFPSERTIMNIEDWKEKWENWEDLE